MTKEELIKSVERCRNGQIVDFKVGFITREIERLSEDEFVVHTTTNGWQSEHMNMIMLKRYISSKINNL
jgi:hypothetical protein